MTLHFGHRTDEIGRTTPTTHGTPCCDRTVRSSHPACTDCQARAFLATSPFRALDGREGGGGDGGGSESRDGIAILGTAPQASGAAIVAAPTRSGKSTQVNRCSHHCCLASPSLSFFIGIGIGIGIFCIILLDWIPFDLPSSICALQKICCRHDPNPVYLIVMDG